QWGEKQTPADNVFRGFAAELGLDMAAFDAAYADPATLERVRLDVADGRALGVQGTPTFFLNGTRFQPRSYEDVTAALDKA
ncbi:DsbA family protein, partial [Mycobacterium kansasii]